MATEIPAAARPAPDPATPPARRNARSAAGPLRDGAALAAPVTERLSDRLAALLKAQLAAGELTVGDRLPTEAALSLAHGVSRSVVREAVHQLKSRGLVLARQGSGVFVAPAAANQPLVLDHAGPGATAVAPVLEVRCALEGEIAALAAERATRGQVAAMRRALAAIDAAAAAGRDGVAEDLAFHRTIAAGTGNPLFTQLLGFLEQYLRSAMAVTRANEAQRQDFFDAVRAEHRAIFDAVDARDAVAARRCVAVHMARATQRLVLGGVTAGPRRRAAAR